MQLIAALFANNRSLVGLAIAFIIASALANIGTINFINETVASQGELFADYAIWFVALLFGAFTLAVISQWLMTTLSYRVAYQLRGRLLAQVLHCEYEHLQALGRNRIYAALTKDVRQLQEGFVMLPFFLYGITLVVASFIYMFWLNAPLATLTLVSLVLVLAVNRVLTSRFQALLRKERELEDELFGGYEKVLDGHKELLLNEARGLRLVDDIMQGPAKKARDYRTLGDRYIVVSIHLMTTTVLALIGVTFWAVFKLDMGTLAQGTAFALTLLFIRQPMNMAMNQLPGLISARVSLKKLQSLDLPEPQDQRQPASPWCQDWNTIELNEVCYRYPGNEQFKFGPVSAHIERGELIFLVGHNGAGKTTLVRLLTGLIRPRSGQVKVDGQELPSPDWRHYRAMFSAVLTDFHLFEQAALPDQGQQDEQARAWLKKLQLDHIVSVDNGEFSVVDLSTGQRKRLAMVSACLEDRSLLVLDEWAADQDPYFRKLFYEELLPELKQQGLTLIVVSHDDRYFHVADRVLELSRGGLVSYSPAA
ncbi:cyclic peptide export ABC transporter [Bacterioplanes sanyensis]|uniref:cyclic peptide export ABC transporter n=1 Tax=Bacterioplanes sanyensis TaxID=1249553 RepID=UPI0012FD5354|nr:cyclic peptide export ABC transporter [Bacterioplanes sanyensis]